jgi:hypothetical protein
MFLFSETSSMVVRLHPPSYSMVVGAVSPGVKRPGRHTDHLSPSRVEVKNEWRENSTFLMCLRGMYRGSFILLNWGLTV